MFRSLKMGLGVTMVAFFGVFTVAAASAEPVAELSERFNSVAKRISQESSDGNAKLVVALKKLEEKAIAEGQLEPVLVLRAEREKFERTGDPNVVKGEAASSLIAIYRKQVAALENEREAKLSPMRAKYLAELKKLRTSLTKEGDIDEALLADTELKRREQEFKKHAEKIAKANKPKPAPGGNAKPLPPLGSGDGPTSGPPTSGAVIAGSDNPFAKSKWEESIDIGPGRYRGEIGEIRVAKGKVRAKLDRVQLSDTKIFVDEGHVSATNCDFQNVRFPVDLGGGFTAEGTVFQECGFGKGGHMFVGRFSAKWTFTNSVFAKRFFGGWHTTDIGIRATDCTFYDIDFKRYGYKDAGHDAGDKWLSFKNCRFVNCDVHETILLAMEDCTFERCRFVPAEKEYKMGKELTRKYYVVRPKGKLEGFQNIKVNSEVFDYERPDAGAKLVHEYRSGRIRRK